jgi:hypothetical protein
MSVILERDKEGLIISPPLFETYCEACGDAQEEQDKEIEKVMEKEFPDLFCCPVIDV